MPRLKRISKPVAEWWPITEHSEGFRPPQYIRKEKKSPKQNRGRQVTLDGDPAIFYKSYFANAARVTFEITEPTLGLAPGWYYISNENNDENLNHMLEAGMKFKLIPDRHV